MKEFFGNTKTIVSELVGVIGGIFWGRSTNWDYEPLILLAGSGGCLLFSLIIYIANQRNEEKVVIVNGNREVTGAVNLKTGSNGDHGILNMEEISGEYNVTPTEIRNRIKQAPLYQQEAVADNFVGLKVKWDLRLSIVFKRDNGNIRVVMRTTDSTITDIGFETNVNIHPIFKIAEDGQRFLITGEIIRCSTYAVSLNVTNINNI